MTIQDFIGVWQAQPFRPFRLHAKGGEFDVRFPQMVGMTPALQVAVVVDDARVELLALESIERAEFIGAARSLAEVTEGTPPEVLARAAQLLAAATQSSAVDPSADPTREFDPGTVSLLAARATDGTFLVQAAVSTRDARPLFTTVGTRWNLHGVEVFENGTSLYLHHLDHPTDEQRVILWPPDKGTFDSFSEAKSPAALMKELARRDARLAAKPTREVAPTKAYFRRLTREPELPAPATYFEEHGQPAAYDPVRHVCEFVPREVGPNQWAKAPRITDLRREEVIFDLSGTNWDAEVTDDGPRWKLSLRCWPEGGRRLEAELNVWTREARIDGGAGPLPFHFVERHLWNFALHARWDLLLAALRTGPLPVTQPDLVQPLGGGFSVELWPGEARWPLPFLQPRFLAPSGRTLLDLRMTMWAASVEPLGDGTVVGLRFMSTEHDDRYAAAKWRVRVDLIAQRVTCPGLEGSTSLGMLQAMLRHVRGVKWMQEDLPAWLTKGRGVPVPDGVLNESV